ncbi:MAG: response regulator transcription factor [Anaerolineae bacterium]|nr:response regulator transcription factor [Anaerolineae bacterium]
MRDQRGETQTRVLLADDQPKVRFALRALLEQQPGLEIVGETGDRRELLALVFRTHPDVVLVEWALTIDACAQGNEIAHLNTLHPAPFIIVLSGRPENRPDALAAGADAFVSKADPPDRLLALLAAQHPLRRSKPRTTPGGPEIDPEPPAATNTPGALLAADKAPEFAEHIEKGSGETDDQSEAHKRPERRDDGFVVEEREPPQWVLAHRRRVEAEPGLPGNH